MTPEQEIEKLKARIEKLQTTNDVYRSNMKSAMKDRALILRKYTDLYRSCKYMGKGAGIILHLERMVETERQNNVWYIEHYKKWGTFYSDWENTHRSN